MREIKRIHVVCFQCPWPPDYGGVIDMYYRLKALHDAGIETVVHTFAYKDRIRGTKELETVASEVHYYDRAEGWRSQLSLKPYIVKSRCNRKLLQALLKDDSPILFEGLHTTAWLDHPALARRLKIVRAHNVEHNYYRALANAPGRIKDRLFFAIEAWRLRRYEKILRHADLIASLNLEEKKHFEHLYPDVKTVFSPVFYNARETKSSGTGDFVLYHGNLTVAENVKAAEFIIRQVVPLAPDLKFVIAGRSPSEWLLKMAERYDNVEIVASPDDAKMRELMDKAGVHLLVTGQATGVKLKLLSVLQRGGRVVANPLMVEGTGLEGLCRVESTPGQMVEGLREMLLKRPDVGALPESYDPDNNIRELLDKAIGLK